MKTIPLKYLIIISLLCVIIGVSAQAAPPENGQTTLRSASELDYPPFHRLVNFRMAGNSLSRTRDYATMLGELSLDLCEKDYSFRNTIEILGPAEAPWEKLKGKYRWQMLIKGRDHRVLHNFTEKVLHSLKPRIKVSGVRVTVDVDPVNLL